MKIALILPTYGKLDYALKTAKSFRKNTTHETLLVTMDDCSPNPSRDELLALETLSDAINRFDKQAGLTRSWNFGLTLAAELGADIAVVGNSDTIFTPGWDRGIVTALNQFHLVGPITNASGWGTPRQNIKRYMSDYVVSDDEERLGEVSDRVLGLEPFELYGADFNFHSKGVSIEIPEFINGFTMAARMETWKKGRFDRNHYFNPAYPMTENEVELQLRWRWAGRKIGIAPSSFVFHYRSVSRGDAFLCEGAYRKVD